MDPQAAPKRDPPVDLVRQRIDAARQQVEKLPSHSGTPRGTSADADSVHSALRAGLQTIPGYEVLAEIHRGGQGVVYRAVQSNTGRHVAIKVVYGASFAGPQDVARLRREVHILAQLRHPNIVSIHDSGVADGVCHFIMDFVDGAPLDVYLANQEPSQRKRLEVFCKICDAVAAAHLRGVIHRDLKPGNILVDQHGEPNILDFGLAKLVQEDRSATVARTMTISGQFVGSLPWTSPEQAEGDAGSADVRSDVYSLGVILCHMLTGSFPYQISGSMRQVLHNIVNSAPIRPSTINGEINHELDTIILKCLQKEPPRRYQSVAELAGDVRHYLKGEPIQAKRDSMMYVVSKHLRRYRVFVALALLIIVLLTASSIFSWMQYLNATRERGIAEGKTNEARERLVDSYLDQARANRSSWQVGRRFDSLATLAKAAAIRPSLEARNEAIACCCLVDLRLLYQWKLPPEANEWAYAADRDLVNYACSAADGTLQIRTIRGDNVAAVLPGFGVQCVLAQFSPDGALLAVKYHGDAPTPRMVIRVWDWAKGKVVFDAPGPLQWWSNMSFDYSGRLLGVTEANHKTTIYDLQNAASIQSITTEQDAKRVVFDPNGERTAIACGTVVEIHDVHDGTLRFKLAHPGTTYAVRFSPDGQRLAVACSDFAVHLWDATNGSPQTILRGHIADVTEVAFNQSGELLLSASWDYTTRVWDVATGTPLVVAPGGVFTSAWPISDRLVVSTGGKSPTLSLCELADGHECRTLVAHPDVKGRMAVDVSPDGRWMTSCADDGLWIWDLKSQQCVQKVTGMMCAAHFDHSGKWLYALSPQQLCRWPFHDGVADDRASAETCMNGNGFALAYSSRADLFCAAFRDGRPLISADASADQWHRLAQAAVGGHVALSADGHWLAGVDLTTQHLAIYEWPSMQQRTVLPVQNFDEATCVFSDDGSRLLTGAQDGWQLWNTQTWSALNEPRDPRNRGNIPSAFSPDSRLAAVMVNFDQIQLINAADAQIVAVLDPARQTWLQELRFTPDGDQLIAAGTHMIQIWNLHRIRDKLGELGLDW